MHCYNHPEITAGQLCGGCLKGLCQNCSLPTQTRSEAVVCSEACRLNFDQLQQMNDKGLMMYGIGDNAKKGPFISPSILAFFSLGIFMFISGVYRLYFYGYDFSDTLYTILGITIMTIGLFGHFRQKKFGLRL